MADLVTAVEGGDYRAILVAIRDDLARTLEDTDSKRDYAAIAKSLMEANERIYKYDMEHGAFVPKEDESPAAKARARHKRRISDAA